MLSYGGEVTVKSIKLSDIFAIVSKQFSLYVLFIFIRVFGFFKTAPNLYFLFLLHINFLYYKLEPTRVLRLKQALALLFLPMARSKTILEAKCRTELSANKNLPSFCGLVLPILVLRKAPRTSASSEPLCTIIFGTTAI